MFMRHLVAAELMPVKAEPKGIFSLGSTNIPTSYALVPHVFGWNCAVALLAFSGSDASMQLQSFGSKKVWFLSGMFALSM
jgi:hypothetical protein